MDRNYRPRSKTDPLETPEELDPSSPTIALDPSAAPIIAEEHAVITPSQAAGVPTEDHVSEDYAAPENTAETYQNDRATPLLVEAELNHLKQQWDDIQAGFVDEPRAAVQQADNLVTLTTKRLADMFAAERGKLESQWDSGSDVSTEDLRLALRRYRSFFQRLLSI